MTKTYDAIIIGTGQAGPFLAQRLAGAGMTNHPPKGGGLSSILDAMYAKAPYTVIQRAMHIHPTVSELIPTMLGELRPLPDEAEASR